MGNDKRRLFPSFKLNHRYFSLKSTDVRLTEQGFTYIDSDLPKA